MQDRTIRTNNIELHYVEHPGGDPPVVLMPGLTANARCFDAIAAGLSPEYRVLALDLRGRGLSEQPEEGYAMDDHAADVIGLMDGLGIGKCVLGGHSFGGLLAIYLGARHADRLQRVVILDAGEFHPDVYDLIAPSLARLGQVSPSWEAYLAAVREQPFYRGWWDPAIEAYYRADVATGADGSVTPRSRPETIALASAGAQAEKWEELVPAVACPALLVNAPGPFGPPGTPAVQPEDAGRRTAEAIPGCVYLKVPGNHMTMLYGEGARAIAGGIRSAIAGRGPR
jgi:pimeloyl-ACP methyl ester carboxylesterase